MINKILVSQIEAVADKSALLRYNGLGRSLFSDLLLRLKDHSEGVPS